MHHTLAWQGGKGKATHPRTFSRLWVGLARAAAAEQQLQPQHLNELARLLLWGMMPLGPCPSPDNCQGMDDWVDKILIRINAVLLPITCQLCHTQKQPDIRRPVHHAHAQVRALRMQQHCTQQHYCICTAASHRVDRVQGTCLICSHMESHQSRRPYASVRTLFCCMQQGATAWDSLCLEFSPELAEEAQGMGFDSQDPTYLTVTVGPRMYEKAHRLVLWQLQGPPPDVALPISRPHNAGKRYYAMHTCNNKRCLNPAHIVWGTNAENARGLHDTAIELRKQWAGAAMQPVDIQLNMKL